ncbi:MAG: Asp-tRNA(Asn)/Glu-tRNA(Gln) amidotransferase subunit GatC [Candidatus Latescibacteria bacterium]|nr:Asp-tRNA(Asn)/Glu-tRNA(Gln) amidotransferase subunit GatC [Candidatus Latescibacterota bacterium]
MAVTLEIVRQVAALARLEFSPQEEERLTRELNRILEYMEKLGELDTAQVEPTAQVIPLANAFRPDEAEIFPWTAALLAPAVQGEEGYFEVPRIID